MYESFFGLHNRPFPATPDPMYFAEIGSATEIIDSLMNCLRDGQGFAILTADAGLGKTITSRVVLDRLSEEFRTVFLANSQFVTKRALLQAILFELDQPYSGMTEQELRLELQSAARKIQSREGGIVLLLDEAHALNVRLLEELRKIADWNESGDPLFRIMLSGELEFEELLGEPELEAFRQRIRCQQVLPRMSLAESRDYLALRIENNGIPLQKLMSDEAIRVICIASDGSPRCLNQLADHSLLLAYMADETFVTEDVAHSALEDLKQLPLHWNDVARTNQDPEPSTTENHDEDVQAPHFEEFIADEAVVFETGDEQAQDSSDSDFDPARPASLSGPSPLDWADDGEAAVIELGAETENVQLDPPIEMDLEGDLSETDLLGSVPISPENSADDYDPFDVPIEDHATFTDIPSRPLPDEDLQTDPVSAELNEDLHKWEAAPSTDESADPDLTDQRQSETTTPETTTPETTTPENSRDGNDWEAWGPGEEQVGTFETGPSDDSVPTSPEVNEEEVIDWIARIQDGRQRQIPNSTLDNEPAEDIAQNDLTGEEDRAEPRPSERAVDLIDTMTEMLQEASVLEKSEQPSSNDTGDEFHPDHGESIGQPERPEDDESRSNRLSNARLPIDRLFSRLRSRIDSHQPSNG